MALIQVNYQSRALYRTVPVNVILPVDRIDFMTGEYAMEAGSKFKTLYLLHGLLGNYTDWVSGTRIQRWAEERKLAASKTNLNPKVAAEEMLRKSIRYRSFTFPVADELS